jgi:D-aminopeptidase
MTTDTLAAMNQRTGSRPNMTNTRTTKGEDDRDRLSVRLPKHLLPRSARPAETASPSRTSAARRGTWNRAAAAVALLGCFAAAMSPCGHAATSKAAAAGLTIYISVDMEGVAGVVTADQPLPSGFEYERFCRFMTDEAVAAVRGAKAAGATDVVVSDSHANGESLLIELFPKDVRIVRSWPRHGAMMAGLDSSFGAALFVGYHASTTNPKGVRAHTISSAHFTRIALNGTAVTEAEFNAAYAGALGVPVVFALNLSGRTTVW